MIMAKERWGVAHIFSSVNNTIVHITDVTGAETIAVASGGQVSDKDMNKGKPFTSRQAAIMAAPASLISMPISTPAITTSRAVMYRA